MMKIHTQTLSGWGHVTRVRAQTVRPEYSAELPEIIRSHATSYIAYGCGRSYGDAALNDSGITICMTRCNHLLSFDSDNMTLICESGVTLRDIQETFLPKGFSLVTSPGTGLVTVGGAIANDVHGKNQDCVGSFGYHVHWFDLLLASGEIVRCSRDENDVLFYATIGGLGLTGIITIACIQLQRHSMMVQVRNEVIDSIEAFIDRLQALQGKVTYSVGWIDTTARDAQLGRGILSTAEPDSTGVISVNTATRYAVPSFFPSSVLNPWSIRVFNHMRFNREKKRRVFSQHLLQFLYPLDALQDWYRLYGRRGFYQFQCVLPHAQAKAGMRALLEAVEKSSQVAYLGVIKSFGKEGLGLLSFPMQGVTLALDFPNRANTVTLLNILAALTVEHQGRVYLAKDACLSAENVSVMYPRLAAFQQVLAVVDPNHCWQSIMAKRLGIK